MHALWSRGASDERIQVLVEGADGVANRLGGAPETLGYLGRRVAAGADRGSAVLMACAALLALSEKAEATFPGKNGKIAYVFYGGGGGIYTTNPGGRGNTKVANGGEGPAYSPYGKRIAYSSSDGYDQEIYTINVGGGGKTKVSNNNTNDFDPDYSPDGKRIVYTGYKVLGSSDDEVFDSEIYMINVGGGVSLRLPTPNTTPANLPGEVVSSGFPSDY